MGIDLALTGPWWAWVLLGIPIGGAAAILLGAIADAYVSGVKRGWDMTLKRIEAEESMANTNVVPFRQPEGDE